MSKNLDYIRDTIGRTYVFFPNRKKQTQQKLYQKVKKLNKKSVVKYGSNKYDFE